MKQKNQEELIKLADELKEAALKVIGNEADRSLPQHISNLYKATMTYCDKRYSA